jgi:predicted lipoprotein with Yx(FWY)xxD motif
MKPLLRLCASIAAIAVAGALAGCSGEDADAIAARSANISLHETKGLGKILVDGKGSVLYVFEPDNASTVSCTFGCASNWPPLTAADDAPTAGEGVDASLLDTMDNPTGGQVVTYNGWPLYRYAGDSMAGEYSGQDKWLNGGPWYVMAPSGEPVIP